MTQAQLDLGQSNRRSNVCHSDGWPARLQNTDKSPLKKAECEATHSALSKVLVGVAGFELATPCTPCKCATRLRYTPKTSNWFGAAGRNRTHDPLVRSQVLYPAELQPPKTKIIAWESEQSRGRRLAQSIPHEFRRDIHNLNHALIRHASRPDHSELADHLPIHHIGCTHH
jgi:hypothetical protein